MSKSLGNFLFVKDLLDAGISGTEIRYFYLTSHYRKPLDFSEKSIKDAQKSVAKIKESIQICGIDNGVQTLIPSEDFIMCLADDFNTPAALAYIHKLVNQSLGGCIYSGKMLLSCCDFLGLDLKITWEMSAHVVNLAKEREKARFLKDWKKSDDIRKEIESSGYKIFDTHSGYKLLKK